MTSDQTQSQKPEDKTRSGGDSRRVAVQEIIKTKGLQSRGKGAVGGGLLEQGTGEGTGKLVRQAKKSELSTCRMGDLVLATRKKINIWKEIRGAAVQIRLYKLLGVVSKSRTTNRNT